MVFGIQSQAELTAWQTSLQQELEEYGAPASMGTQMHQPGKTSSELLYAADKELYRDKIRRKAAGYNAEQREFILRTGDEADELGVSLRSIASVVEALRHERATEDHSGRSRTTRAS